MTKRNLGSGWTSLYRINRKLAPHCQIQILESLATPARIRPRVGSQRKTGCQPLLLRCTNRRGVCRDNLVFDLYDGLMRTELLKTHLKPDSTPKNMQDVVAKAKALESAQKANKLITDTTKGIEEQVKWVSHKQMKLKRESGTCQW